MSGKLDVSSQMMERRKKISSGIRRFRLGSGCVNEILNLRRIITQKNAGYSKMKIIYSLRKPIKRETGRRGAVL